MDEWMNLKAECFGKPWLLKFWNEFIYLPTALSGGLHRSHEQVRKGTVNVVSICRNLRSRRTELPLVASGTQHQNVVVKRQNRVEASCTWSWLRAALFGEILVSYLETFRNIEMRAITARVGAEQSAWGRLARRNRACILNSSIGFCSPFESISDPNVRIRLCVAQYGSEHMPTIRSISIVRCPPFSFSQMRWIYSPEKKQTSRGKNPT